MELIQIARRLGADVDSLRFAAPVTHVYNPLSYAWRSHRRYLERYGSGQPRVLLLGMNPGPFGMAQTGVPFGDVGMVRDWLDIEEPVEQPAELHPKRPIDGFGCSRGEVSGWRLWGWARDAFDGPEEFFRHFFVWNYCPLCFMEDSGRNRTPDKLPRTERNALFEVCDRALERVARKLRPTWVVGLGRFAEERAHATLDDTDFAVGRAPHPSPASPAANRGWAPLFERALADLGIALR